MQNKLNNFHLFITKLGATRGAPIPPIGAARIHRAIPEAFPTNTRIFVQNTDGEVFTAQLTYIGRGQMPSWVMASNYTAQEVGSFFVEMPNSDHLFADITKLARNIDINDAVPLQPRCFIVYRRNKILVAHLEPYARYSPDRPRVPRVIVRIPEISVRYTGEFERFYGRPPKWLE